MAFTFQKCENFGSLESSFSHASSTFSCFHVNIRSIRKYWDQFTAVVKSTQISFDVFVLTEINLPVEHQDQFSLPGYSNFFFNRLTGRGGGILVSVRDDWLVSPFDFSFTHSESLLLRLVKRNFSILLWAFYRPPSNSLPLFLSELSSALSGVSAVDQLCMIGDFNIDSLDISKSAVYDYLALLSRFGIENTILSPTREEYLGTNLVSSCIDHVNVRAPGADISSAVIRQKFADHYITACQLTSPESTFPAPTTLRRVTIVDQRKFDELMSSHDWHPVLESLSPGDIYRQFVDCIHSFQKASSKTIILKKRRPAQAW